MFTGQSPLGLAAAWLYVAVLLACIAASMAGAARNQPSSHTLQWAGLAVLFAALFAMRALGIEEELRQGLRANLLESGDYDRRREYQRPMVAAVIVLGAAVAFWLFYRIVQSVSQRRMLALSTAMLGGIGIAGLLILRIISLHQVDAVLYGPLKLNWVGDVGASLWVMAAAIYYARVVTGPQR